MPKCSVCDKSLLTGYEFKWHVECRECGGVRGRICLACDREGKDLPEDCVCSMCETEETCSLDDFPSEMPVIAVCERSEEETDAVRYLESLLVKCDSLVPGVPFYDVSLNENKNN